MLPSYGIGRLKDLCSSYIYGKLIPTVKNAKEDLNNSENYKCISIMVLLSKLFDFIMLHMLQGMIDISSAQFIFRAGQSTYLCCNIF